MKDAAAVRWFKMQFQKQIETALADTPFSVDLLTAIAMQETGYLWRAMVEAKLGIKKILELCVGDTIDDTAGRGAFPKNKAALIAASNGQEIFNIARAALEAVAPHKKPPIWAALASLWPDAKTMVAQATSWPWCQRRTTSAPGAIRKER